MSTESNASLPNPETPPETPDSLSAADSPPQLLQQGLDAYQQGRYSEAIRYLNPLLNASSTPESRLKAQVGLIKAYAKMGNTPRAIALCQQLQTTTHGQVQTWATTTLAKLQQTQPNPAVSPTKATSPPQSASLSQQPATDLTGFVPLSEEKPTSYAGRLVSGSLASPQPTPPQATSLQGDITGFVPLETEETSTHATPPAVISTPEAIATSSAADTATTSGQPPEAQQATPEGSLFHYATLNRQPGGATVQGSPISLPSTPNPPPDSTSQPVANHLDSVEPENGWWHETDQRLERLPPTIKQFPWQVVVVQILTAIALLLTLRFLVHQTFYSINSILNSITWPVILRPIPRLYRDHTAAIGIVLIVCVLASPWVFDQLLQRLHGMRSFSTQKLSQSSPEAVRLLRRICQQQGWLMPELRVLTTPEPLSFSYGFIPRYGRIVISEGLLETLSEDEIASLYAYELTHMQRWDWPMMSGYALLLYLIYLGYWYLAQWGNRFTNPTLKIANGLVCSLLYSLYWLLRKIGLWLSQMRIHHCDRNSLNLTGNPNGLIRTLLKLSIEAAKSVEQQQYLSPLMESLDLITPINYQAQLSLGSTYPATPLSSLLQWDLHNPYRHWLNINNSHPLMGERLTKLTYYANNWGLQATVHLTTSPSSRPTAPNILRYVSSLLLQGAPFFGPIAGGLTALLFWFIGGLAQPAYLWQVSWWYGDRSLLNGLLLLGFGFGTMLRINAFFPDCKPSSLRRDLPISNLLSPDNKIPTDSLTLSLQGKLIGRQGLASGLYQNLFLQTSTGLIKLHYSSVLGVLGGSLTPKVHPNTLIGGRSLTVIGWFRRGAVPWIDLDYLQTQGGKKLKSYHPIWSTFVSLVACLMGIYTILRG